MFTLFNKIYFGIKPLLIIYLLLQTALRIGFIVYDFDNIFTTNLLIIFKIFAYGIIFDLAAFSYILIPISIYLIIPASKKKFNNSISSIFVLTVFLSITLFTCLAETLFWEEFNARFNFIAVDYLVYTQEVIGNIKESYPVKTLLTIIAVISLMLSFILIKSGLILKTSNKYYRTSIWQKLTLLILVSIIPILSFFLVNSNIAESIGNRYQNEIAKNGYFSLFSAFRNNALDYNKFYLTDNKDLIIDQLRQNVKENESSFISENNIYRHISGKDNLKKYNVVLIIVESLSANFLKAYGNIDNITPNLDELLAQSISFSNMRAIGTRTVYGLAAINLSIPPIPGNSIVKRPDNENLFSLASVFNNKGYESKFLYGGFGYFDNMNYFFSNNGYTVVDRTSLNKDEITFANIWGVCDENLFTKALKEADKTFALNKPFLQVIMTTSNHRPYTYPDNKIDIPSKTGRNGGVKYTDYAIGKFINEAKKHDWFQDTIFIITADHTASSAGKTELSPDKYHIPFIIYAPEIYTTPHVFNSLASQIDIPPTILGLLEFSYDSKFYGQNLFKSSKPRAFISNFQNLVI